MYAPPKLIQRHCRKHGITWKCKGECLFEFTAPKSGIFPNDRKRRIMDFDMFTDQDIENAIIDLSLF